MLQTAIFLLSVGGPESPKKSFSEALQARSVCKKDIEATPAQTSIKKNFKKMEKTVDVEILSYIFYKT